MRKMNITVLTGWEHAVGNMVSGYCIYIYINTPAKPIMFY
jgi:hypothetical protein